MWGNIKIRTRLFVGLGILLILFIIMGWFSLRALNYVSNITTEIHDFPIIVSNTARDIHSCILKIQKEVRDAILSENEAQLNEALQQINENEQLILKKINILKERFIKNKEMVDQFIIHFNDWNPMREVTLKLAERGKKAEAAANITKKDAPYVAELIKQIDAIINLAEKEMNKLMAKTKAYVHRTYTLTVVITLAAIIIAFFITYSIIISITRPLRKAVDVANHLAMNDISINIEKIGSADEMGMLLQSMKEMLDNLHKQIQDLMSGVNVVADTTTQISTAATQFASSFNEIAASISETVTSMKEVKQTSELSSEKAKYVSDSARNVVNVSQNGEKSVNETISVMDGIREQMTLIAESIVGLSEQTKSIGEIITVVDDIAGQSRLLAVNASIEAVKAGEQGKGFSVVASEIKNLALQSRESTNQVRTILTEIQKAMGNSVMITEKANKTVDNGAKQATKTGETIQKLKQSIQESSQASMQIEATVRQQLAGIEQVFTAMEDINTAIIQNTESVSQLETAIRTLEELGKKLKSMAQNYKL